MFGVYGLKDYLRCSTGRSLKMFFCNLFWEVRYAWQRAWRGYDDTDVFELAYNFTKKLPVLLKDFKKNNDLLFTNMDRQDGSSLTIEETNAVLDELIFYFENCELDAVCKRLYGDKELSAQEHSIVVEEHRRCWDMAFQLFAKWSICLWF